MYHAPNPYRLTPYPSPHQLLPHNETPMYDKTHHLWITSNDHFTKQFHLFSNQKLFGYFTSMIIYIQNHVSFFGSEFSGSHCRLRTSFYTFTGFHRWTHMYNQIYRGFHWRGYLSLFAITRHIFSFSCVQPCDSVGRCPTILSPPNQTLNVVLIITMHSHPYHAMFLSINAMRCAIVCYIMPHA